MKEALQEISQGFVASGDSLYDMQAFLMLHGDAFTAEHCRIVAEEAGKLALQFEEDPEAAYLAGLFHDISAVVPKADRAVFLERLGVDVFEEEIVFPMIAHQRISAIMAREIFGIKDRRVLSAIECHTTLKGDATRLDKVVFVADKIRWDQKGVPPYLERVKRGLEMGLDDGCFGYIEYLWEKRETLPVMHRWLSEAYEKLAKAGEGEEEQD